MHLAYDTDQEQIKNREDFERRANHQTKCSGPLDRNPIAVPESKGEAERVCIHVMRQICTCRKNKCATNSHNKMTKNTKARIEIVDIGSQQVDVSRAVTVARGYKCEWGIRL